MSYVSRKSWKNRSSGFRYSEKNKSPLRKIIGYIILLFLVYEIITSIFIITYRVDSISMEPTIPSGAVIMASPLFYGPEIPFTSFRIPGIRRPMRGDLVVSNPAYHQTLPWYRKILQSFSGFFTLQKSSSGNENRIDSGSVKRIVGIPGDSIKMEDYVIMIKPEGKNYFFSEKEIIQVEYSISAYPGPERLDNEFPFSGNMREIKLGEGEYFLCGDNRSISNDSYYWGAVTIDNIKAKVAIEYAPDIKLLQ
ncbi:MAG: signal peptidase I [Spirochaetales bacterium]|uniref:Signal peptidase I n=1 Tax=Candidatus Thalassospirochaeta sargassi TaxID=3119039 RepID=A0AAJ1IG08_9SPIO|nr:signal peptidase I [Spirochaetales bacterium]